MRIGKLARGMAEFRITYAPAAAIERGEIRSVKELTEYYRSLLRMDQVIPLFFKINKKLSRIIALAEVWLIRPGDVELIKSGKPPQSFFNGEVCYVANVTIAADFKHWPIYRMFRKILKLRFSEATHAMWFDVEKKKFFIRKVIRGNNNFLDS